MAVRTRRRSTLIKTQGGLAEYRSAILADNPHVYTPLTDGSGTTAMDISGNSRNGAYYGSPILTDSGPWGASSTCMTVTAVTKHMRFSTAQVPQVGDWTVECWVRVLSSGYGDGNPIWSQYHDNFNTRTTADVNLSILTMHFQVGNSEATSTTNIFSANTWTHVTWRRTANLFEIFCNGVPVASFSTSSAVDTKATWVGGMSGTWATAGFGGSIAEFSVIRSALSNTRIMQHYTAGGI